MKRAFLIFFLIQISLFYSEEFLKVDYEVIISYDLGDGVKSISGPHIEQGIYNLQGIAFDNHGNILVSDNQKYKIFQLDEFGQIKLIYDIGKIGYFFNLFYNDNYLYAISGEDFAIWKYNTNNLELILWTRRIARSEGLESYGADSIFYAGKNIFLFSKGSDRINSVEIFSDDLYKIRNQDETEKMLISTSFSDYSIDKNGMIPHLKLKGYNYTLRTAFSIQKRVKLDNNEEVQIGGDYLGMDSFGICYGKQIETDGNSNIARFLVSIINPSGNSVGFIDITKDKLPNNNLGVHPSGDLYYFTYNKKTKQNELVRIKNTWFPEERDKWYTEHSAIKNK